jgi:hypothetical protein
MKKLILAAAAVLLAAPSWAQYDVQGREVDSLLHAYDVASASLIYCSYSDSGTATVNPLGWGRPVAARVKTTGSSTSVTAVVASSAPFAQVAVGDRLTFLIAGAYHERIVTVRADADNVTVNAAIDLSAGYSFAYKKRFCGTAAGDGWFSVAGAQAVTVQVQIATLNATSITTQLECRLPGMGGEVIGTAGVRNAVGTYGHSVPAATVYEECRIGLSVQVDGGAQSVNAVVGMRGLK